MSKKTPDGKDRKLSITTVYLDPLQLSELQHIKKTRGIPIAFLIRQGAQMAIDYYKNQAMDK